MPDKFLSVEDTPLVGNVLLNDFDVDSKTLSAVLLTGTTNGKLSLGSNGDFTYVPLADFNGLDQFTYTVTDGGVLTVSASVPPGYDGQFVPPAGWDGEAQAVGAGTHTWRLSPR